MSALLLALVLGANTAQVEEEHAALEDRLAAERAAFDALATEKKSVLTLLDRFERLSRESAQRTDALQRGAQRLQAQLAQARADDAALARALEERRRQLSPRLLALYRLERQGTVGFLLRAQDFASLLQRQRGLKTLVGSDLQQLEALAELARYQRMSERRLERLEDTATQYRQALEAERAVGEARRARFSELLATVGAEQNQSSRLIADLEAQERDLASLISELHGAAGATGFRAKRGHLPLPTRGVVEVGFGRVVNPRFHTITVQKGLDVRAAAGTPVVAVAEGTVVYAGWLKGYGNLVIIDHGQGYHSLYAHLARALVEPGNALEQGEQLGEVGDTGSLKGAYLYFEIRRQGQAIDPLPWLDLENSEP